MRVSLTTNKQNSSGRQGPSFRYATCATLLGRCPERSCIRRQGGTLETQKLLTAAFALASFASKSSAAKPLIFELSAATDLGSASLLVPPLAECRTYAPLIAGVRLLRFASKRIVAVGLGLLLAAAAHAAGYRFTKLAETDGTILQVSLPAINQLGVVTYRHVTATRQVIVTNNG